MSRFALRWNVVEEPYSSNFLRASAFPADEEEVYWDMVKITKLPPGKAIGADDLQNWSRQRNAGRSGTRDDRREEKRLRKQKRRRERWLRKHRRKYPCKGLADIAFEEALNKNL